MGLTLESVLASRTRHPHLGRRFDPLPDNGTVLVKLKLYLRKQLIHLPLEHVAAYLWESTASLSRAVSGDALPSYRLVHKISGLDHTNSGIGLWRAAALETLGLQEIDLTYPTPTDLGGFASLLRAHMTVGHLTTMDGDADMHKLVRAGARPPLREVLGPGDVAVRSKRPECSGLFGGRSLSLSTVNRMLGGRTLPSERALILFLHAVYGSSLPDCARKLLSVRSELAEKRRDALRVTGVLAS